MGDSTGPSNPLITTKAPDAALSVQLHPLVLLTITDYITRHISRQQANPIVGAVVGQQHGRSFTLEHAYECKTSLQDDRVALDADWFADRLEQYKDVHKAPALDLVAVFMLGSTEGPVAEHAEVVKQVQKLSGIDAVMLVLFHADLVDQLSGGKLPITLYESVNEQATQSEGGATGDLDVKFRELSFEVETGEAEMIAVDFVATGGGNATAVPKAAVDVSSAVTTSSADAEGSKGKEKKGGKGKGKAKDDNADAADANVLSPEDEELIASLTAKANAIKMLNERINLIREYLKALPPNYLTDAASTDLPPEDTNHTALRSINAMLSRLPLLAPPAPFTDSSSESNMATDVPDQPSLDTAATKEQEDVHLTALLSSLTRSISEAQSMGSKFHAYNRERMAKDRGRGGFSEIGGLLNPGDSQGGF
jgi:COP9 signalosome complex subunit 6